MLINMLLTGPGIISPTLNIKINRLVKQVTEVLSKSNISDQLRDLEAETAQCTLDFLQDVCWKSYLLYFL